MAACHASQVFQWLPFHDGLLESLPDGEAERLEWLKQWFLAINAKRKTHFATELKSRGLADALAIEAYEISEYARPLDAAERERLFPGGR